MSSGQAPRRPDGFADDAVKGTALSAFLAWYAAEAGATRIAHAVSKIPASERARIDATHPALGILPGAWYSSHTVHALLDALFGDLSLTDRSVLADRAGRRVIDSLITGVYAGLFRAMASPELYAAYAHKLWSSFYRKGRLAARVVDAGETHVEMAGWPGHHAMICDINTAAAVRIFERMGCLQVESVRESCVDGGARLCATTIRYVAGVRGR